MNHEIKLFLLYIKSVEKIVSHIVEYLPKRYHHDEIVTSIFRSKAETHVNVLGKKVRVEHKGPIPLFVCLCCCLCVFFCLSLLAHSICPNHTEYFMSSIENVHNKLIKWLLPLKCVQCTHQCWVSLFLPRQRCESEKSWIIYLNLSGRANAFSQSLFMFYTMREKITNALTWWIFDKVNVRFASIFTV